MKGILGRKIGMTQLFTNEGKSLPVTIIEVKPNIVTKICTIESDGYESVQLGIEDVKKSRQKKPQIGHFAKAQTLPKQFVKELRNFEGNFKIGDKINGSIFQVGELVDVIGNSKGKGFAGAIKRHNQSIGPKSHGGGGGSQPVRQTGSLGDISGNKVVKGMTMPGQMGNKKSTQQNLEIVMIDIANNVILVKGSIPGPNKSFVIIRNAVKQLPNKEAVNLINFEEIKIKNNLLDKAKKLGVSINKEMSSKEIEEQIKIFLESQKENAKEEKENVEQTETKEEVSKNGGNE